MLKSRVWGGGRGSGGGGPRVRGKGGVSQNSGQRELEFFSGGMGKGFLAGKTSEGETRGEDFFC